MDRNHSRNLDHLNFKSKKGGESGLRSASPEVFILETKELKLKTNSTLMLSLPPPLNTVFKKNTNKNKTSII